MKLDSNNVLKALLDCIANPPDDPTGCSEPQPPPRDGLPVVSIEGVPCAIDCVNGVIQTGEDREQRWFEVALHDVTPKRFLSREEQEAMMSEAPDWWMVTAPSRMAFVRAKCRSQAMLFYAAAFHEKATDCELARSFDFVDPATVPLPEDVAAEAARLAQEQADASGQAEDDASGQADEDGDESGDCDGLRPDEEEPRGMRLVVDFPITDADDEMRIKHPDEFEFDMKDQAALDAIQSVVDDWESKGTTIDQGGDAGHYELSLAGGCEVLELDATIAKAKQILDDVARALRDAGISSAPAIPDAPEPAAEAEAQEEAKEGEEEGEGSEDGYANLKPEDCYFGVGGGGGGLMDEEAWLMICPKSYWNANHRCYDGHLGDVWKLFPDYLQSPEDMECTWMLPDGKQTEDVAIDMAVLGFERNLEIEGLLESIHES